MYRIQTPIHCKKLLNAVFIIKKWTLRNLEVYDHIKENKLKVNKCE